MCDSHNPALYMHGSSCQQHVYPLFSVCFRGGKDREGEMRYNPFRITPYLLKVQGTGNSGEEEEPCCLALAERIISGYEGMV